MKKSWKQKLKRKAPSKLKRQSRKAKKKSKKLKGNPLRKWQRKRKSKYHLSTKKNSIMWRYHQSLTKIYQTLNLRIFWLLLLSHMLTMFLILGILLDVCYLRMSMLDSWDSKVIMFCTYVGPMSMVQQLKLKHLNKRKLLNRFVIITIKSTKMSMNGLTLILITLEGQAHNGMLKFANKSFWIFTKTKRYLKNQWYNVIAKIVIYFWPIDLFGEPVHTVNLKMPEEISAIIVKSYSIAPQKWKIITVVFVNQLLLKNKLNTFLLIYLQYSRI